MMTSGSGSGSGSGRGRDGGPVAQGVGSTISSDGDENENLVGEGRDYYGGGGPWQKVLWKRQPYADNHVPASFLEGLVTNAEHRPVTLWPMVVHTMSVTQQMSLAFVFGLVFVYCNRAQQQRAERADEAQHAQLASAAPLAWHETLSCEARLVLLDLTLVACGLAARALTRRAGDGASGADADAGTGTGTGTGGAVRAGAAWIVDHGRFLFLFVGLVRIGSPLLRTLTSSYSDDTIYALALTVRIRYRAEWQSVPDVRTISPSASQPQTHANLEPIPPHPSWPRCTSQRTTTPPPRALCRYSPAGPENARALGRRRRRSSRGYPLALLASAHRRRSSSTTRRARCRSTRPCSRPCYSPRGSIRTHG